jgi:cation:H+ antiporter
MIWALEQLEKRGLAGTVLGTSVMPYCSGLSNLMFAYALTSKSGSKGGLVLENCLVNNITNLTLLLGLPTLIWGMELIPSTTKKQGKGKSKPKATKGPAEQHRLNRLSLLLTLFAALFFTAALFVSGKDGKIDQTEGMNLIGIFLFWQMFQVFDVLKYNVHSKTKVGIGMWLEIALVILGGYIMFNSIDSLIDTLLNLGSGFIGEGGLGWLSGWIMVLPNAMLAIYYSIRKRSDIAYSSQVGDGHICIPLCIGLYAIYKPIKVHEPFIMSVYLLMGVCVVHILMVMFLGRLPKWLGGLLVLGYGYFLYEGLVNL